MKSRREISAGGVVTRENNGVVEVLIVRAASYKKWVLPKGLVGRDEPYETAALRETREEGGVEARVIAPLGEPERYIYTARDVRVFKEVHYFLMAYVAGSVDDHDHEVDAARWVPLDEAISLMGYEGAKNVLRRAKAALEAG